VRVLIVNSFDIQGGAARATYRLHQALLTQNIDSKMLVQYKDSDDSTVLGPCSKIDKLINALRPRLDSIPFRLSKSKASALFSHSWLPSGKLIKKINKLNPDVVHLHWINAGMLRIEDLAKINAPIVWSLHDLWPLNGGWHYDELLVSPYHKWLNDRILRRKKNTYLKIKNMTVIGVSQWLKTCARTSTIFGNKNIISLPNPLDTEVYKPLEKKYSREAWNLPKGKKIILFGAMSAESDPRKGFKELLNALSKLKIDDTELVVFGSTRPKSPPNIGCQIHYMGNLSDDISLATLYSAVDVMIVPSRQEAFGQTASEAMACGVPVVAFGHTGLLDIIDHKRNGYLAKPFDIDDLVEGIKFVLDADNYSELSQMAREKVLREFDSQVVVRKYINVYEKVIEGSNV